MKNTLAENMLRFGTKNLSDSAKRKLVFESIMQTINEHGLQSDVRRSLLTESFKSADGITYQSNFKDQASFDKYVTFVQPASTKFNLANVARASNKDFGKLGVQGQTIIENIFRARAINGTPVGVNSAKECLTSIQKSYNNLTAQAGGNTLLTALNTGQVLTVLADTWWDGTMNDPDSPAKTITRWVAFIRYNYLPFAAAKKALILPASTTPK